MEFVLKHRYHGHIGYFLFQKIRDQFFIRYNGIEKRIDEHINDLFVRAHSGDQSAYAEFLHSITPKLTGMVRAMVFHIDAADIEDIVQDILITIHTKRHTWDHTRAALPWVYTVARHRIIDYGRKAKRNVSMVAIEDVPEVELSVQHAPEAIGLEEQVNKLGGKLGKVTRAMGIEGKSIKETSKLLGMSENAVRIAFHRALKKIRAA